MIEDCHLASSYNVKRQQVVIFVSFVDFATSNLEGVANRRKNLVHALGSNHEKERVEVLVALWLLSSRRFAIVELIDAYKRVQESLDLRLDRSRCHRTRVQDFATIYLDALVNN